MVRWGPIRLGRAKAEEVDEVIESGIIGREKG